MTKTRVTCDVVLLTAERSIRRPTNGRPMTNRTVRARSGAREVQPSPPPPPPPLSRPIPQYRLSYINKNVQYIMHTVELYRRRKQKTWCILIEQQNKTVGTHVLQRIAVDHALSWMLHTTVTVPSTNKKKSYLGVVGTARGAVVARFALLAWLRGRLGGLGCAASVLVAPVADEEEVAS